MIKIFPIIIIPSIFIIIFFNVKNLTQTHQQNSVIIDKKIKVEESFSETTESAVIEEKKNHSTKPPSINPKNQTNDLFIKDSTQKSFIKNVEEQNSDLESATEKKNSNLVKKSDLSQKEKNLNQDDKDSYKAKSTMIQFGAFSKLKNAEKHKNFLNEKLSKEFSDFEKKLKIKEDNKLFKIIYSSDSLEMAKKVCKFSKSLKVGCLILKK